MANVMVNDLVTVKVFESEDLKVNMMAHLWLEMLV